MCLHSKLVQTSKRLLESKVIIFSLRICADHLIYSMYVRFSFFYFFYFISYFCNLYYFCHLERSKAESRDLMYVYFSYSKKLQKTLELSSEIHTVVVWTNIGSGETGSIEGICSARRDWRGELLVSLEDCCSV